MANDTITHRRILHVAAPIVVSNATVPILGLVDTGVVGQMGLAAPIGAVGVGAIVLTAVYWIFGFLRMGTAGLTAQADGAGDQAEVAALLTRALMVGGIAGFGIIGIQTLLFSGAFWISPATAEVEGLARQYMAIRIWSAPAAIALYGITGWLIAQERTRAVLVIQVWMNGLNILLDLVFVLQLGWGVQGVAFATFLAEWSGLALGLWFCRAAFADSAWRAWSVVFDRVKLLHMSVVNGDIMIRSVLLQIIFTSFLLMGGDFGDVTLAANQILLQFLYVTAYAMDGFAFAAEAIVGKAYGAKRPAQVRKGSRMTGQWGLGICVVLSGVFWIAGPDLLAVMAKSVEVQEAALVFLPWMIAAPILGCASWMLDGIFIGCTRTRDMRNMMILSALVYGAAVLILVPWIGNHGLWAALIISFVARGLTLSARFPALVRSAQPV